MLPGGALNPPPLLRPHAVVRLRRHVADAEDLEPGGLQRTDRRLAARARPLHEDLDLLQSVLVHSLTCAGVGGRLRGKGCRLARALEAHRAGGLPRDDVPLTVGQRDDRVVERRLDVRLADRDVLADAAARATARRWSTRRSHLGLARRLLAAADGLLRALARARVGLRALPVDRQATAMTDAAVRADLAETLDRLRALAAEVAFDLQVSVDVVAQLRDLLVREVAHLRVGRQPECSADLLRGRLADAVDVRQPDLEPLLVRQIDSCDTCHVTPNPGAACAADWCR